MRKGGIVGSRAFVVSVWVLVLACSGDPTSEQSRSAIRVVSQPAGDTIRAILREPLVLAISAAAGTPVVLRSNIARRAPRDPTPTLYFSRTPDTRSARAVDTVATDGEGRVSVYLRLGTVATEALATVFVPSLGDSLQVRIDVKAGAPTRLVAAPRDSALYVGRRYALRVNLVDTFDNPIPVSDVTFTADSGAASVSGSGEITGRAIGRARIRVQTAQRADTVWTSVVPQGRIAAVRYGTNTGDTTFLVLVDLDGSGYRTFRLQLLDVPRPAWHPDGSYLIASILPSGGSSDATPRLARLDTATGSWRSIRGTQEAMGDGYAQFSRDGQWIYLANAPTNRFSSAVGSAISRVRADGSLQVERVGYDRESGTVFDHPSPSPDGSRVAMTVDAFGMYTLIVPSAPPLGRAPQGFALVSDLPTGGHPRWSPVGDDLMMFGTEGMWIMRAGARSITDRRYLARAWIEGAHVTGGFTGASWSPDGKWIVAKAAATLILVEVATDRVLPLAFGGRLADPAWRPR